VVVSSDFKRTRETAEILHAHLLAKTPIRFEKALRERWYGAFDMMPSRSKRKRNQSHSISMPRWTKERCAHFSLYCPDEDNDYAPVLMCGSCDHA